MQGTAVFEAVLRVDFAAAGHLTACLPYPAGGEYDSVMDEPELDTTFTLEDLGSGSPVKRRPSRGP